MFWQLVCIDLGYSVHIIGYRITGNVWCDFIFAKVKKRENLNTCNFHNTCILYCACSVCAKIKSRKNLKLTNFATQTFLVIRYKIGVGTSIMVYNT